MLLLASAAFGTPTALAEDLAHQLADNPETMSAYVRQYYKETPILADIAWCESRNRQLDADGTLFRGKVNHDDVGIMQINTNYHEDQAKEMDMDLYSLSGNLAYAQYLYDKEGTKPWASSQACWGKLAKK